MTLQLTVSSMVCDGCVETVTKAVKAIDPAATVQVNLETKSVTIDTQVSETSVKDAITATGHTVR
jgi:copper chaperone